MYKKKRTPRGIKGVKLTARWTISEPPLRVVETGAHPPLETKDQMERAVSGVRGVAFLLLSVVKKMNGCSVLLFFQMGVLLGKAGERGGKKIQDCFGSG